MNDSPSPLSSGPADLPSQNLEMLWEAHQSLRTSFHIALVMLLVLAGSLFVFFLREVSLARRQISELAQMVADYEKTSYPVMEGFRAKLHQFTQAHPDFAPIYIKYFGPTGNTATGSAPARMPGAANSNAARLPPPPAAH